MVSIFDFPLGKFGGPKKDRFVVIGAGQNSDSSEDFYLTPPFLFFILFIYFFICLFFLNFIYFLFFFTTPPVPLSPTLLPFLLPSPPSLRPPSPQLLLRPSLSLVRLPLPLPFELSGVFLPLVCGGETPVCSVKGTGRILENFGVESLPTIHLLLLMTPFGGSSATGIVTGPWNSPFP